MPPRLPERLAQVSPTRWLLFAAILHFSVTVVVFIISHYQLFPSTFDRYGIGVSFAIDGTSYRTLASDMAGTLFNDGFSAWANFKAPLHSRLYSLSFVFPGSLVGHNILAAEPLNLLYYLVILVLVYRLTKALFDSCAGLVAAGLIAVWPSFLLFSTQLLRDSMAIALMLALLYILVLVLQLRLTWTRLFLIAPVSVALLTVFWLARGNVWNIVQAAVALTLVLLIVRFIRERKVDIVSVVLTLLMMLATLVVPSTIESTTLPNTRPPTAVIAIAPGGQQSSNSMWQRFGTQIRARRKAFLFYSQQSSNIDAHVQFNNFSDVVRFVPRATVIGFFAPFPRQWFGSGITGRSGRLLAGAETLVMYLLYAPAFICAWTERRKLGMWLIFLVATMGIVALGLVVVNAGALYRLRYTFWMLVIVLAAKTISDFINQRVQNEKCCLQSD